eukprot:CAMPEP_0194384022 /NCGR_PEP_ID=MMETSP0174-20130528/71416_1 /TAXON_ID=216777 /ORGANISM="Proboscia alata, Strain PI-D3" /LENGTH=78 /DNA_ID=CAMNT_0039170827 /DNA_START=407 /DNA_END=640 /DNA_ORIENTATION=-
MGNPSIRTLINLLWALTIRVEGTQLFRGLQTPNGTPNLNPNERSTKRQLQQVDQGCQNPVYCNTILNENGGCCAGYSC